MSRPTLSRRTRLVLTIAAATILVIGLAVAVFAALASPSDGTRPTPPRPSPSATPTTTPSPTPSAAPASEPPPAPTPVPTQGVPTSSIDDPASIHVVVNKQRPLQPASFAPSDLAYPEIPNSTGQPLRHEVAVALERMHAEAAAAGVPFAMVSGFRSFDLQTQLFNNYSAAHGVASAETFSARPGHSEHQTGLAVDISECHGCALSEAFSSLPQGLWARENAHRFGFILRYDQGMQPIVGYVYEPWHFRYVGVELATDMRTRGIATLEEYFGLPAAPTY